MTRSKLLPSALLILLGVATAMLSRVALWADVPPAQGVRLTPIGNPTWKPVDFHLFSAPVGTADTGYAEFLATTLAILPPPNHVFVPALGVGPGAPHPPPYDSEIADGVNDLGFHQGVQFNRSELSNGEGVFLAWMNIPAPGVTGSSPDSASGPIIPNTLFPIHVSGISLRNDKLFDPFLVDSLVPPLDASVDPSFAGLDGHSHFPFFIADSADFGPAGTKVRGSYDYHITMIDQSANGWLIEAHFAVAPEG